MCLMQLEELHLKASLVPLTLVLLIKQEDVLCNSRAAVMRGAFTLYISRIHHRFWGWFYDCGFHIKLHCFAEVEFDMLKWFEAPWSSSKANNNSTSCHAGAAVCSGGHLKVLTLAVPPCSLRAGSASFLLRYPLQFGRDSLKDEITLGNDVRQPLNSWSPITQKAVCGETLRS